MPHPFPRALGGGAGGGVGGHMWKGMGQGLAWNYVDFELGHSNKKEDIKLISKQKSHTLWAHMGPYGPMWALMGPWNIYFSFWRSCI